MQMQYIERDLLHMEHLYRMVNFFFLNLTDSLSFFSLFGAWCLDDILAGLRVSMLVIFSNHLQALRREKGHH